MEIGCLHIYVNKFIAKNILYIIYHSLTPEYYINMLKNKNVILLSACINPNGMAYTALQDSNIRKNQYIQAIKWYLTNTSYPIVFVENSGVDIGHLFNEYIEANRIEFITFQGNNYDRSLGKGYGEALIIKKAIEESRLIADCDYIIKITGRLIIKNIKILADGANIHKNRIMAFCGKKNNFACSSFFFIAPRIFFESYFLRSINKINDSQNLCFEHILYEEFVKWILDGNYYHEFYHYIDTIGISGSTGKEYPKFNLYNEFKTFIKAFYINVLRKEKYIYQMKKLDWISTYKKQ